jgi:transposase-like protein
VLCGRERRWTTAEKFRLIAESLSAGLSVVEFARRHDFHPNLLHVWRLQTHTGKLSAAPVEEAVSVGDEGGVSGPAVVTPSIGSACLQLTAGIPTPEHLAVARNEPSPEHFTSHNSYSRT